MVSEAHGILPVSNSANYSPIIGYLPIVFTSAFWVWWVASLGLWGDPVVKIPEALPFPLVELGVLPSPRSARIELETMT